jgi:hypothetical protein
MNTILLKNEIKKLPKKDMIYAVTVIPFWLTFTIYLLIGVPIF